MIWFLTKITIATCYRVCVEAEGSLPDWRGRDRFRGPGVAGRRRWPGPSKAEASKRIDELQSRTGRGKT
jgi:hypothetical protein